MRSPCICTLGFRSGWLIDGGVPPVFWESGSRWRRFTTRAMRLTAWRTCSDASSRNNRTNHETAHGWAFSSPARVGTRKQEHLNFDCVTDGPFDIDVDSLPAGKLNVLDLETAIEIYTPLYQLFLSDSDFWRACNSLQLDETVAIYTSRLMGDLSYISLVNNKHPLIPMSTLQAGYRLLLHGLAAECLHATLVQCKRGRLRSDELSH